MGLKGQCYGWTGKLLRVDLTKSKIEIQDTLKYGACYLGGRGIAARIAWDELEPGIGAFSPQNLLMIITGPLCGTNAPFSGRTSVCGLAPQGYPAEWFTRSSFGGHWGPMLKYAGWDGVIFNGASPKPIYILIENEKVEIKPAEKLWGKGIYETQLELMKTHGKDCRIFCIGQAGENLSRIAVAQTETESASGQGGFGAVMGYKKLKAIVVRGNKPLKVAYPKQFHKFSLAIAKEAHGSHGWPHTPKLDPEKVKRYGQRFQACTQGCQVPCYDARFYSRVPSVLEKGKIYAGQVDCIAQLFFGPKETFYNWDLGFEAGFEICRMTNDFGLNHWELTVGMIPWLRECFNRGELKNIDELKFDLGDINFWAEFLKKITFRKGSGDAFSEGSVRAAERLDLGKECLNDFYPAWGYAGHWDGHGDKINFIFYPFWLVSALQWAMDTRDPISSGHGYCQNVMGWSPVCSPQYGLSWEEIMEVGERVFGSKLAVDPRSHYEDKAIPAVFEGNRSVLKDCLPLDDQIFPRIFSRKTKDHLAEALGIPGTSFEYYLFKNATGIDFDEKEFNLCSERIINLERMLLIRNFDRKRDDDESVIPYFEKPETRINPFINKKMSLDREKFLKLMDEYYQLRGWDKMSGKPLKETLKRLGLWELCGGSKIE